MALLDTILFCCIVQPTQVILKTHSSLGAKKDCSEVKPGLRVKITELGETTGMMIVPKHLNVRAVGIIGIVKNWVPGHGGDVWFVEHEGSGDVGAYVFNEFEHKRHSSQQAVHHSLKELVGRLFC